MNMIAIEIWPQEGLLMIARGISQHIQSQVNLEKNASWIGATGNRTQDHQHHCAHCTIEVK